MKQFQHVDKVLKKKRLFQRKNSEIKYNMPFIAKKLILLFFLMLNIFYWIYIV